MEIEKLEFKQRKSPVSKTIGILIIFLIIFWFIPFKNKESEISPNEIKSSSTASVLYKKSQESDFNKVYTINSSSVENNTTTAKSLENGVVKKIYIKEGDFIESNKKIVSFENKELSSEHERNAFEMKKTEKDYLNALSLFEKGIISQNALENLELNLSSTKDKFTKSSERIKDLEHFSKISGVVSKILKVEGEEVSINEPIIEIKEIDPIKFIGYVSQKIYKDISIDDNVSVVIENKKIPGVIKRISKIGDTSTRTFPIEVIVENQDLSIPVGLSAKIEITLQKQKAHIIPGSSLVMSKEQIIGINTVKNNKVKFYPVEIISSDINGVWVSNIPEKINLIVSGQNFVTDGDMVNQIEGENE